MLLGSVLGPVGAIGGAIGGAIVGSRAGVAASNGVCDVVESTAGQVCTQCKADAERRSRFENNWGGGRLGGAGDEPQSQVQPGALRQQDQQQTLVDHVSNAASAASERVNEGWAWVRHSASSAVRGRDADSSSASDNASRGREDNFAPFSGSGRMLSTDGVDEPIECRNPSHHVAGGKGGPARLPTPSVQCSQVQTDDAFARQLQEKFFIEEQQGQQHW